MVKEVLGLVALLSLAAVGCSDSVRERSEPTGKAAAPLAGDDCLANQDFDDGDAGTEASSTNSGIEKRSGSA